MLATTSSSAPQLRHAQSQKLLPPSPKKRQPPAAAGAATRKTSTGPGRRGPAAKVKPVFMCSLCNVIFKRSEHLIRHQRSHTLERPFGCQLCGTCFTRKDLLVRHQKTCKGVPSRRRRKSLLPVVRTVVTPDGVLQRAPTPTPTEQQRIALAKSTKSSSANANAGTGASNPAGCPGNPPDPRLLAPPTPPTPAAIAANGLSALAYDDRCLDPIFTSAAAGGLPLELPAHAFFDDALQGLPYSTPSPTSPSWASHTATAAALYAPAAAASSSYAAYAAGGGNHPSIDPSLPIFSLFGATGAATDTQHGDRLYNAPPEDENDDYNMSSTTNQNYANSTDSSNPAPGQGAVMMFPTAFSVSQEDRLRSESSSRVFKSISSAVSTIDCAIINNRLTKQQRSRGSISSSSSSSSAPNYGHARLPGSPRLPLSTPMAAHCRAMSDPLFDEADGLSDDYDELSASSNFDEDDEEDEDYDDDDYYNVLAKSRQTTTTEIPLITPPQTAGSGMQDVLFGQNYFNLYNVPDSQIATRITTVSGKRRHTRHARHAHRHAAAAPVPAPVSQPSPPAPIVDESKFMAALSSSSSSLLSHNHTFISNFNLLHNSDAFLGSAGLGSVGAGAGDSRRTDMYDPEILRAS